MSGTSASIVNKNAGFFLPVPHIVLANLLNSGQGVNPQSNPFSYTSTAGDKLAVIRMPLFSAVDLPKLLFDNDLRLELLWYRNEVTRQRGGGSAGYRHPTHSPAGGTIDDPTGSAPPAAILPTSRFRGNGSTNEKQVSEWSINKNGQKFHIATLAHFFTIENIDYRDVTGGISTIELFVPRNRAAYGLSASHKLKGYSNRYRNNYFRFRFSIADPSDLRARITGPETQTIVMGNSTFAFSQDVAASQAIGKTCLRIAPGFDARSFNCWFSTRLNR